MRSRGVRDGDDGDNGNGDGRDGGGDGLEPGAAGWWRVPGETAGEGYSPERGELGGGREDRQRLVGEMTYSLGVDLGTTYSAAAIHTDEWTQMITLGYAATIIPSAVLVTAEGETLVGEAAIRRGATMPERLSREFKRRIGDSVPILLGGSPFSAEALTGRLLAWIVETVVEQRGEAPERLAVTYPANWGPFKQDRLDQAIRLADLPTVVGSREGVPTVTLTEPEAAAMAYAAAERVPVGVVVAVYDLGGGTFDGTVLRKTATGFEVLGSPEGIERLGGIDIDEAVFQYVARAVGTAMQGLTPDDPTVTRAVARLRQECVEAKEALSSDTEVAIPVVLPDFQTEVRLTRRELEDMVRPVLDDSVRALRRAIASADISPSDVDRVLLVGGSSRIPLVAQLVTDALERPVFVDAHPKHTVALGAAQAAGHWSADHSPARPVALSEDQGTAPTDESRNGDRRSLDPAAATAGAALAPDLAPDRGEPDSGGPPGPDREAAPAARSRPPGRAPAPASQPPGTAPAGRPPAPAPASRPPSPAPAGRPGEVPPAIDPIGGQAGTSEVAQSGDRGAADTAPGPAGRAWDPDAATVNMGPVRNPSESPTIERPRGRPPSSAPGPAGAGSTAAAAPPPPGGVPPVPVRPGDRGPEGPSGPGGPDDPAPARPAGSPAEPADAAAPASARPEDDRSVRRRVALWPSGPQPPEGASSPASGRRRWLVGVGALVAVVVAVVVVMALQGGGDDANDRGNQAANGRGTTTTASTAPPATPTLETGSPVPVGEFPDGIDVADDTVIAASTGDHSLTSINVDSGTVSWQVPLAYEPLAVLNAAGSIWVTQRTAHTVARIDPESGELLARVDAPGRPADLSFGAGSIWAVGPDGFVTRINPADNTSDTVAEGIPELTAVVASDERVWLTYGADKVAILDPSTNQLTLDWATIGQDPDEAVLTDGGLWVLNRGEGTASKLDRDSGEQLARVELGTEPTGIVVDVQNPDRLWVIDKAEGTLTLVDGPSAQVLTQQQVGTEPLGVTTTPGRVWVTLSGDDAVAPVNVTG